VNQSLLEINSNTTASLNYDGYLIDASANDVTVTLPDMTGMGDGKVFSFTRLDTSSFTVTIVATATTIDGGASIIIAVDSFNTISLFDSVWKSTQSSGYSQPIMMAIVSLRF